jgi:hypothetical protein
LIAIKAPRARFRIMPALEGVMHWFVWFVVGAMSAFLAVLGLVTMITRGR